MSKLKLFSLISSAFIMLTVSGCAGNTPMVTKGNEFPKMYQEPPKSLLVLPPMNFSSDAEAKDYYLTTIETPLAQMGYYVFPVEMVSDIMKQEGVYDTELLYNMPLDKFYEYFGADAVLFTRIVDWKVAYYVLNAFLTVTIESEIKSSKTSEQLWTYRGSVQVDLSGGNGGGGGGLLGLLVQAIETAIKTAAADYVEYAHVANARLLHSLPVGHYHPQFMKDQDNQVLDLTIPPENPVEEQTVNESK